MSITGQIVLPQAIRAGRRWKPGPEFIFEEPEFIFEEDDGGVRLKPAVDAAGLSQESLIGCVG